MDKIIVLSMISEFGFSISFSRELSRISNSTNLWVFKSNKKLELYCSKNSKIIRKFNKEKIKRRLLTKSKYGRNEGL